MDERARQGAERLRRAAARTGGALSQAAGRAAEQAGAWGRAAEQAGRAASQVAGQVAGQAARAAQALVARPDRPIIRLHLLGENRVGVDDGARFRLYEGVPHAMRGSLVMTSGRATRAELWISDRRNIGPDVLDSLGDFDELGEVAAAFF